MGRFSEETLKGWHQPASNSEEERINHAINMIKDAIRSSDELKGLKYEIFVQGSYGNNTNVRQDSDVDVNVMLTSTFYAEYPEGKTDKDYFFSDGTITYDDYRGRVIRALEKKFGKYSISEGNKSVKINANSYRVNADCVISMQYRNYKALNSSDPNKFIEGVKFFSKDGSTVINYPKIHINNGKNKNINTSKEYKKLVRIFKRVRNRMVDEDLIDKDVITSFLLECLVWNIPNSKIVDHSTWNETVRYAIAYLHEEIINGNADKWGEVSEWFYLFHAGRKWTKEAVADFLVKMWRYMGYDE